MEGQKTTRHPGGRILTLPPLKGVAGVGKFERTLPPHPGHTSRRTRLASPDLRGGHLVKLATVGVGGRDNKLNGLVIEQFGYPLQDLPTAGRE